MSQTVAATTSRPPVTGVAGHRSYNTRLGLFLFSAYFAVYAGFIAVSAFNPGLMKNVALAGMNLAVVYGLGLIIGAFVLALLYMVMCKPEPAAGPELTEAEIAEKAVEEEGGA